MKRAEMLAAAVGILHALVADAVLSIEETRVVSKALKKARKISGLPVEVEPFKFAKTSRENCIRSLANAFALLVSSLEDETRPGVRVETVRTARLVLQLGERLHPMLPEVRKVILRKLKKIQAVETNSTESVTNDMRAAN